MGSHLKAEEVTQELAHDFEYIIFTLLITIKRFVADVQNANKEVQDFLKEMSKEITNAILLETKSSNVTLIHLQLNERRKIIVDKLNELL